MDKIEKSSFRRLLGIWKTNGEMKSGDEDLSINGLDSYELILDGNFILHKSEVKIGTQKSETLEIIRLDKSFDKAIMQFFNSRGENGMMVGTVNNNELQIEGIGLKFEGCFSDDDKKISGKWYRQSEDKEWVEFIRIKLEKQ